MSIRLSGQNLVACSLIAVFAMVHVAGLGPGRFVQKTLASLVVLAMAAFVVLGPLSSHGSWAAFHGSDKHFSLSDWLLALLPVMFAYSGWNAAAYVSEEMRGAGRAVGPALALGTGIVLVLYLGLNAVFMYAMPLADMSSTINVGDVAAQRLFGVSAGFMTPMFLIAFLGAISAMSIAGPRVYFAMAREGSFPQVFSRISNRFETPASAILLQAGWSMILVLLGEFQQILIYTGFAIVLSSGATVAALFVIRHRRGLRGNALRAVVIPAVFSVASALMVGDALYRSPKPSLMGLLLIAAGIPVYVASRRRNARERAVASAVPETIADTEG